MTVFVKPALNTIWADRGDTNTPSDLKIARGWVVEIPPHQQMNWWMKRVDSFLVHMNQRGIPAWDATMQYYANLSYVQNPATGVVYRCIQDSLNNNPTSSPQYWVEAFMARGNAYTKAEIDAFRAADKTYADTSFLRIANNLSDVPNKAAARANLQIYSSIESNGRFLQIANNLSELTDIQAARATLQVYSNVEANTLFVAKTANLSDLTNKTVARANLGLGNSATLNVGQSAGTVAAGDDYRIVNAVPNGRGVYAGAGLVGGGNLTQDRWISMGTPRTITSGSTNATYGDGSHSHAVSIDVNAGMPLYWTNVTGARANGVTYYNTTGKTMWISVTANRDRFRVAAAVWVNGELVGINSNDPNEDGNYGGDLYGWSNMCVPVPAGASYSAQCVPKGIYRWMETR